MTDKPTDTEIDTFVQVCREKGMREIAIFQAVLDKWGQPAHSGEPVAWMLEGQHLVEFERNEYHAGGEWTPLYTAPQPVEREPLTDEQSYALLHRMADESDKWAEGLSYEPTLEQVSGWCVAFLIRELPAHGIKKAGQHGTE